MAEASARLLQCLPEEAATQMRLCEGLDGLLDALGDRIARLRSIVTVTEQVNEQIASLAQLLTGLISGSNLALEPFTALAEAVVTDARQGVPLKIHSIKNVSPACDEQIACEWLARHVASHSLNVANIVARVSAHSSMFCEQPMPAVLAALLHDVGMLATSFEIIAHPGELTVEQRRIVAEHTNHGARLVVEQLTGEGTLADAVRQHHERLDGSGYSSGLYSPTPLARILAVCDVYAALIANRPHRPALSSELAETKLRLMAEHRQLDPTDVCALLESHITGAEVC
jgi:HD-GYP domain-containing protein (c-di-GMP phosphodiesterase class II)